MGGARQTMEGRKKVVETETIETSSKQEALGRRIPFSMQS